ncbi:MAG TPA: serine hydrolase [Patescibacteria group bacterium]|nr:serine hydrolase [Patescibacteria group bacterium]
MKDHVDSRFLIFFFLLINICLIAIIFIFFVNTQNLKVFNIDNSQTTYSFPYLPTEVANNIKVSSRAFIIYDADARAVVTGKNEKLRFSPASAAKIMAATIVIENYDLKKILRVTSFDGVGADSSKMGLKLGESISVENLLYGMMLPSGNDAAYVLAENYPGGISAFVDAMNKKARELKIENTNFFDPDGYDDKNYTTAYDLARLAAYSLQSKEFAKVVATKKIVVTDSTGSIVHNLENLNELLGVDGVTGVKTGFTDEAGGVLVTSIKKNGRFFIVVVLNSTDRFLDTKNVINEGIKKVKLLDY